MPIPQDIQNKRKKVEEYFKKVYVNEVFYSVLQDLLSEFDASEDFPADLEREVCRDILIYVAGLVIENNRDLPFRRQSTWDPVALNSEYLRNILPRNYPVYLEFLRHMGWIVVEPEIIHIHSRSYSLPARYISSQMVWTPISSPGIRKKIIKWRKIRLAERIKLAKKFYNVLYWYLEGGLIVNEKKAMDFLENLRNHSFLRAAMSTKEIPVEDLAEILYGSLTARVSYGKMELFKTIQGKYNLSIDLNGYRVYSSVVHLMSPLRNFLSYGDQELVAIDLKNSQPYHLSKVFESRFWGPQWYSYSLITLFPELFSKLNTEEGQNTIREIRRIVKDPPPDLVLFKELVQGGLYEWLTEHYRTEFPREHRNRASSKSRFMIYLNFKPQDQYRPFYKDYQGFKRDFPNVCFIMEGIKKFQHQDMSTLLFRLEALMLLHEGATEFGKKFPHAPLFSVHDSLITVKNHKNDLIQVIEQTYLRFMGSKPTLVSKSLNPANAYTELNDYLDDKLEDGLLSSDLNQENYNALAEEMGYQKL